MATDYNNFRRDADGARQLQRQSATPAAFSMPPRQQQPGARQADGRMVDQVHQQGVQLPPEPSVEQAAASPSYSQFESIAPQQMHGDEAITAMRREQAVAQSGHTARHADGSPSTGFASRH